MLRHLTDSGLQVIATDVDLDPVRPGLVMSKDELATIQWEKLDVTDHAAVQALVSTNAVTNIIHLAGLQIPFCKANPSLGAAVNVTGTINMLEAARNNAVQGFSYASSIGVMGPDSLYKEKPIKDDAPLLASTLYGVYKAANESSAKVYWQDWQVPSVGLRPYCVYGVGRDQGMTADLAKAVLAIAADKPFHIRFDGMVAMQHASDVAKMFIDAASGSFKGATVCNLRGDVISVEDYVAVLKSEFPNAQITYEKNSALPYPADLDDSGLLSILPKSSYMSLTDGLKQDMRHFKRLLADNLVDLEQLNR